MESPVFVLVGTTGQLEVFADKVIIKRNSLKAKLTYGFFKGDKTIYLNKIAGVQVNKGGMLADGYIQFTLSGSVEGTHGLLQATQDENTVLFDKAQNDLVEKIQQYIERQMKPRQENDTSTTADELIKLGALLKDGLLTQAEFDDQKRRLLSA